MSKKPIASLGGLVTVDATAVCRRRPHACSAVDRRSATSREAASRKAQEGGLPCSPACLTTVRLSQGGTRG